MLIVSKALASIKAKTLILMGTKDLLNPEIEPTEMGKKISGVKMMTIAPSTMTGHASAGSMPTILSLLAVGWPCQREVKRALRHGV